MYGFTMYTIMLILLLSTLMGKVVFSTGRKLVLFVATIGMIFSGSLLVLEFVNESPLTICAAGFSMFLLIFVLSLFFWKDQ
jgi:hypothetical protein